MKEEALKLAEIFEEVGRAKYPYHLDAAEMIRRLVEELDKQGEPVAWWNGKSKFCSPRDKSWDAKTGGILSFGCNIPLYTTPQTKPLSDEEIWEWFEKNTALTKESALRIARAIEERHGIK